VQAPFLIGPRVYLRAVEARDAPLLTAWMNDPEVTRFVLSGALPLNEAKEAGFIERMYTSTTDVVLLVCLRDVLPALLKRLSMFVMRAKVKLSDASGEFTLLGLAGLIDPQGHGRRLRWAGRGSCRFSPSPEAP
jgi:hypothetical protein